MVWLAKFLISFFVLASFAGAEERPWVFFDLGKTIVEHGEFDEELNSYRDLRYMPGGLSYLERLKSAGFRLGMIIDIPERWGETRQEKLGELFAFVARGWKDAQTPAEGFDWELFDVVLIPESNFERKSTGNSVLFERALALAGEAGSVYQGENPEEIDLADCVGMAGFQVGVDSLKGHFFATEGQLERLLASEGEK